MVVLISLLAVRYIPVFTYTTVFEWAGARVELSPARTEAILRGEMSEENVEIVRELMDAFSRKDYERVMHALAPDVEMVSPQDLTGGGAVGRGHDETSKLMGGFLDAWTDYHHEVRSLVDCGDVVLAEGWQTAKGRESGVEVSEAIYTVFTVGEGKVVALRIYRDRAEARKAAGLSD
jgi:ketosteroid isomerase-like protein